MYPIAGAVLRHFDLEKTPYDEQFADRIAKQRRTFPDEMLFLDRLFDLIQIRGKYHCWRYVCRADRDSS